MVKKLANGFATKKDILHLEKKMDKRFEQVDRRFEQVDKRFEQVDKRFEQVNRQFVNFRDDLKQDWNFFKSDTFREFEHRWQQQIDPILREIVYHREKENLVYDQYQRIESLLLKVAKKVGIQPED